MSGAIQQDVSPRDKAMQELIESRKGIPTAPREEGPEAIEQDETEQIEQEEQKPEVQAPSIPMIELEDDEGNIIKVPATAKYRSKVDGQDHLEPLDKITRSYQKGAAADRRLEEATRRQREIEAREQAISKREVEIAAEREKASPPKGDPKTTARRIMSAINDLDDDEAVDALADALSGLSGPDANALITAAREAGRTEAVNLVREREQKSAFERAEKERNTANEWFATEYSDVVADPLLLKLAMARGREALEEDPRQDRMKLVKRLGDELREWKAKLSPGTQRNRPAQTPPSIAARAPKPVEKKPQTRADVLAEMKRMRGQPV